MTLPSITSGQIAIDPVNRIFYYIDSSGNLVNSSLNLLQSSNTLISTDDSLAILGNSTTIESTVTVIKDPIITLGLGDSSNLNDNADRGIEFVWNNGTSDKLGFFGFDKSSGNFTFIPDATNQSEVFSGDIGELDAKIDYSNILNKPTFVNSITGTLNEINVDTSTGNVIISLPATAGLNISGTSAGWTTARKITLAGDLEGNVTIDGGSNVTLDANIIANSVTLGTDTAGDYVANITAGTGITIISGSGEQSQPIIAVSVNAYDAYGSAATAESNSATDASTKATAAYNNSVTYTNNQLSSFGVDSLSDVTINTSLANSYLRYNGSSWVNDQVDLGVDTTGNYVESLIAGTGILITNNSGESTTPTIAANISLDNLVDVNVLSAGNGNLLGYDGNSNSWVAISPLDLSIPTGVQYEEIIGDGSSTEFLITHGFSTLAPFVAILRKNASNKFEVVNALWEVHSSTEIKVYVETAPLAGEIKVVVFGSISSASLTISSLGQLPDVITSAASSGDVLYRDGSFWVAHALHLNDLSDVQGTNNATPNQFLKYNGSAWVSSFIPAISNLNDIEDVTITSASIGQFLKWNGSSWVNSSIPLINSLIDIDSSLDDIDNVSVGSPSTGDFLKWSGTEWVNDPINLGTDTQGNYMSNLTAGTGVTVTHTPGEGSTATIAIGQVVGTASNVQFAQVTTTGSVFVSGNIETTGNLTVAGDLTVLGNAVTLSVETIVIEDKTIQLGTSANPSNTTADGSGIVVPDGSSDKSFTWSNSAASWSSSESLNLNVNKVLKINGVEVLSATNYTGEAATVAANSVTSAMIVDGAILNADVNAAAAIGLGKLADATIDIKTVNYPLVLTDKNKFIKMNSSSNRTITVPLQATVDFPEGSQIHLIRYGSGTVEVVGETGAVILYKNPGAFLRAQYSSATLLKCAATNTWMLMGDLSAS